MFTIDGVVRSAAIKQKVEKDDLPKVYIELKVEVMSVPSTYDDFLANINHYVKLDIDKVQGSLPLNKVQNELPQN